MKQEEQQTARKEYSKRKKREIAAAVCLVIVLISIVGLWMIGGPLVEFVSDGERLRMWVDDNWLWSRLAYLGIIILQIVIAIIPGEPFEIAAGYAFGAIEGTAICILGSTLGGAIVFLLVKRFGTKLVEIFFSLDKINSLKFLHDSKKRDILVFFLFFLPGTPKDALCYFVGLTKMDLKTWLIITTVAKFPSIVTSTIGGIAIRTEKYGFAVIVFAITLVVSVAGMLFYNAYTKRKQSEMAITKEDQDTQSGEQK